MEKRKNILKSSFLISSILTTCVILIITSFFWINSDYNKNKLMFNQSENHKIDYIKELSDPESL